MRNFMKFAFGIAIALAASLALPGAAIAGEPFCGVSIDKKVDCGSGDFLDACVSWNEAPVKVKWTVANGGTENLVDCYLTESNGALDVPEQAALSFDLAPGTEVTFLDDEVICSEAVGGEEDTATVVCQCPSLEVEDLTYEDTAEFSCHTCGVTIDKQVDCAGDGLGPSDGPCVGWNAYGSMPAEEVSVQYLVHNTGDADFVSCQIIDDNGAFLPDTFAFPAPGETTTAFNDPANPVTCSDELDLDEPDTATVNCECGADNSIFPISNMDVEGADFECQTPVLNITKECVPTDNFTGEPTVDFVIEVANPGVVDDSPTLSSCVVDDVLAPGPCPVEGSPEPQLSTEVGEEGTLAPGDRFPEDPQDPEQFLFAPATVDELSCNQATVTCDIEGTVDPEREGLPKQISEMANDECPPPPPLPDCLQAEKDALKIKAGGKLLWKWQKGEATSKAEFGNPTTDTDYRVCLYGGVGGTQSPPGCADVPAGSGWKDKKNGYAFKSDGGAEGITSIKLKAGESGKAKILVKGADGVELPLSPGVVVQISNSEGVCWESSFSEPDFNKNDEKKFKAKTK